MFLKIILSELVKRKAVISYKIQNKVSKKMSLYDLFEELQSSDGTVDIANLEKEVANEYDVST